ncbi:hypothetical protein ABS71_09275 [bacterium SCN 62-11]|nr:MAG: hypothetical protein ABS71_09275 [bacterium SCN 62-11]
MPEETQVAVMEGAVEVKDLQSKYLGVAQAGDVYHLRTNEKPDVKTTEKQAVVREHLSPDQISIHKEAFLIRAEMARIRPMLEALFSRLDEMKGIDENPNRNMVAPYGAAIGMSPGGGFSLSAKTPSPSGTVFSWDTVPGADGYVLFVSDTSAFSNILFSDRLRDTRAVYPDTARPLKPGRYFWRVVPVGDKDQVLEGVGAAQSTFEISAAR